MQEQRTFKSFIRDRIPKMNLNSRENSRNVNGSNSIPMTMTQQQQLHQQHIGDSNRDNDTGGFVPLHPSHHTQISSAHSSQQSAQHAGRQPNTLNVEIVQRQAAVYIKEEQIICKSLNLLPTPIIQVQCYQL